jgi:hypothetical protein
MQIIDRHRYFINIFKKSFTSNTHEDDLAKQRQNVIYDLNIMLHSISGSLQRREKEKELNITVFVVAS